MSGPIFRVTRRQFLRTAGIGTGSMLFGFAISPNVLGAIPTIHQLFNGIPIPTVPFVEIKGNGDVVIITHRPEMGQGTRSTLAAALADEMEADWDRVTLRQADADGKKFAIEFPFPIPPDMKLPFPYGEAGTQKPQYLIPGEAAQFADSSRSVAAYFVPMRLFGTALRLSFIRAAAKKWNVKPEECRAEKHRVIGPNGRSIDYRWLLLRVQKVESPTYPEILASLKKPEEWRYIGKGKEPMPFYDAMDIVCGKTVYGADVEIPGMLTAMIERCPVANGKLRDYDASAALAVDGVHAVVPMFPAGVPTGGVGRWYRPHAGVAVIAKNTWSALQGRRKLRPTITWDYGPHQSYDSTMYRKEIENSVTSGVQPVRVRNRGDVERAFGDGGTPLEATYYVPHLAQTPMEPLVAVALFKNGHMEVWAPTQSGDVTQTAVGQVVLDISDEEILKPEVMDRARAAATLHFTMLGGGFGRKSQPDYVVEAAMLAKQMPGTPIRVQWTREDDVKFGYYNSASSQYFKAVLGGDGVPTAILQRSALTSFFGTVVANSDTPDLKPGELESAIAYRKALYGGGEYPYASGIERAQGLEDMPYNIPNIRIENTPARNHIRTGWMRSVANVYHAFGTCSFADEMGRHAAGNGDYDAKTYLLNLIGKDQVLNEKAFSEEAVERFRNNELPVEIIQAPDKGGQVYQIVPGYPPETARLKATIAQVAKDSDWDNKVKQYRSMKGRGLGIAAHRSFLSYVAIVVDASLNEQNELTIHDIYGCIDCGLAVNRDRVVAQMQGGILYGLSYALLGEITVKNGAVVQNNFDDYQVLRIHQTPNVHVSIIDSTVAPTGVGEPPTPAVAPALANAIVAAGGPRIRAIPFHHFVKVAM